MNATEFDPRTLPIWPTDDSIDEVPRFKARRSSDDPNDETLILEYAPKRFQVTPDFLTEADPRYLQRDGDKFTFLTLNLRITYRLVGRRTIGEQDYVYVCERIDEGEKA